MLSLLICVLPCFAAAETPAKGTEVPEEEVTIVSTYVNDDGDLILVMSDGTERNAGATEEIGQEPTSDKTFFFSPGNFVQNLYYMGVGMVGIFIVIGIIVLSTLLLNRLFRKKAEGEKQ